MMKKFTLIFAIMIFMAITARSSEINIRLHNNKYCFVEMDYQLYGQYAPQHTLTNVAAGSHYLKVYTYGQSRKGYHNYNNYRVIFQGYVSVPAGVRLSSVINPHGRFVVVGTTHIYQQRRTYTAPRNSYHDRKYKPRNEYHQTSYSRVMSETEFQNLISTIRYASFESSKFEIARAASYSQMLMSTQVLTIMNQFSFEST